MFNRFICVLSLILLISACGGGGGGAGKGGADGVQNGVFLDSAVLGLRFETATESGVTGADGGFTYLSGETISFYVGDILLGSAVANATMTPVSLVPGATDESNPQVTNIARFLQTLDSDGNPENGISIDSEVIAQASGQLVDFALSISDFETNVFDVIEFLTQGFPGGSVGLVSVADAQAHLNATLAGIPNTGTPPNTGSFGTVTITGVDAAVFGSSYSPDIASSPPESSTPTFITVTWLRTNGGALSATKETINGGIGDAVVLSMPVSGSDTETYTYLLTCVDAANFVDCQNFSIDKASRTATFNNIVLTEAPSSGAVNNVATAPITLNGTLTW